MKTPKVELKKVKTFRGTDGYGLNADIHINGVKCLLVIDEANGGCFNYQNIYDEKNKTKALENIALLKEYIKNQPKKVYPWGSVAYDMDMLVDDILAEQEEKKLKKMLEKNRYQDLLLVNQMEQDLLHMDLKDR
jgi:transcription initiation factor IIF auxiliary subunit